MNIMVKMLRSAGLCLMATYLCACSEGVKNIPENDSATIFKAESASLDIIFKDQTLQGILQFPLQDNPTVVNLGSGEEAVPFCLAQGHNKLCLELEPGKDNSVSILYDNKHYLLDLNYMGPQALFDSEYRALWQDTVRIEIPELYEMVNVAISLSDRVVSEPGLVAPSPYMKEVQNYFGEYRDHPFVLALNDKMKSDPSSYHTLKMNGVAFDFSDQNIIEPSKVYASIGWAGNVLAPHLSSMQSFSDETGFRQFYASHRKLYDKQISMLRDDINIADMMDWLESEFQEVERYDSVRVIFSPLVGHNQSLASFENQGFRELQPHVNYPYPNLLNNGLKPETAEFLRGLIFFTELNHGFIQDSADAYSDQIHEAMGNWRAAENSAAASYDTAVSAFTEMLNWALFSVYATDKLTASESEELALIISENMVEQRGFPHFKAFQADLLRRRQLQKKGESLVDVLPEFIADLSSQIGDNPYQK